MATAYVPSDMKTAGNATIILTASIADMNAPTVAELDAGIAIECATRGFGSSTNVSTTSDQYLCDVEAREEEGARTRSLEPIEYDVADPQAEDAVLAIADEGMVYYVAVRYGVPHGEAVAADKYVDVFKVRTTSVDRVPLATSGNGKFGNRITTTVLGRAFHKKIAA